MKLELVRLPDRVFPTLESPLRYKYLRVWHCRYETLQPIEQFRNLVQLEILTVPDDNLSFLPSLTKLKRLKIIHFPKVSDLNPIGKLHDLVELELNCLFSWFQSRKRITVESFKPISKLSKLKTLDLAGVDPLDGDVLCLRSCSALKDINGIASHQNVANYSSLTALLPNLKSKHRKAWIPFEDGKCKKCHQSLVLLVAGDKPTLICRSCKRLHFDKHVEKWEQYQLQPLRRAVKN